MPQPNVEQKYVFIAEKLDLDVRDVADLQEGFPLC